MKLDKVLCQLCLCFLLKKQFSTKYLFCESLNNTYLNKSRSQLKSWQILVLKEFYKFSTLPIRNKVCMVISL